MKDLAKRFSKLSTTNKTPGILVNNFEKFFADRFPKAFKVYYILKSGTRRFAQETKTFASVKSSLSRKDPVQVVNALKWDEVNIYREIPRDWKVVAPVMVIASFPFLNYIILPLAYIYPQKLLCKQFWTRSQQLHFEEAKFNKNLVLYDRVLVDLKQHIDLNIADDFARKFSLDLIENIEKKPGEKVDLYELVEMQKILNKPDFNLNKLKKDHLQNLVDLHNCRRVFTISRVSNLEHYAYWLNQEDRKLMVENLDNFKQEYINSFAFERGINAKQHSAEELFDYLQTWFRFSSAMGFTQKKSMLANNYTLFLHAKVLLSKNFTNSKNQMK